MKLWNYIGEFFLFRWLFGKFRKSATEHAVHAEFSGASNSRNIEFLNGNHGSDIAPIGGAATPVDEISLDESDNSEELDDLDIFMKDNNGYNQSYRHHGDYGSDYHSSGRHSFQNDWNSGSSPQSYDDFHDEQDDYDMIDEDF